MTNENDPVTVGIFKQILSQMLDEKLEFVKRLEEENSKLRQ